MLFRGIFPEKKKWYLREVLISLARGMLFREYPSGTRINKGLQAAVGNNCTQKHLIEF
jgi:hypothetical protein